MIRYGAVLPAAEKTEIRFFRTSREIDAGTYASPEGEVEIAESTAALLMAIYPRIRKMQVTGQSALRSPGLDDAAAERLAEQMTDSLARRLAEDDGVWEDEPGWIDRVAPAPDAL